VPILHVRNVPDELYERIRARAAVHRRSITAETVALLEAGLSAEPTSDELEEWWERARRFRERMRLKGVEFDATAAIREDRER
jgi:plasmid stability protein